VTDEATCDVGAFPAAGFGCDVDLLFRAELFPVDGERLVLPAGVEDLPLVV
jgi:hypothetical protein